MESPTSSCTSEKRNSHKHPPPLRNGCWKRGTGSSQSCLLPPGPEQRELLRQARETKTTAMLNDWLTSPGLQTPK